MHYARDELALRPNTRAGLVIVAVVAVLGTALSAAAAYGAGAGAGLAIAVVFGVLLALSIGHFLRAKIALTPDQIVVRGLLFQQRRARARAAEVVRADIDAHRAPPGDTLFVLDEQGELLIRIAGTYYAREDVDRLVESLGVPCGGPDRTVTAAELATMYPDLRLVSFVERHPWRIGFAVTGVLIAVIAGLMLVATVAGL
ncbi:hypothetical protein [Streptomonospora halophila]